MRKSPDIKERICQRCGNEYKPTGMLQKYCKDCKPVVESERKKAWFKKTHPDSKPKEKSREKCCICGGDFSCHFENKPYCNKHYQSMRLYGQPYGRTRKSTNTFELEGEIVRITTNSGDVIIADADKFDMLKKYSWGVSKTGYAIANIKNKVTKMHRYILGLGDPDMVIDHINHNTLDNRLDNLRVCTQRENSKNNSGRKGRDLPVGISLTKEKRYRARIMVDGKEKWIGSFSNLQDAINARKEAELKYCGEFAQSGG